MTFYFGTDKETADKILEDKFLPQFNKKNGPLVSTSVEDAISRARQACEENAKPRPLARVVIITNVASSVLNSATKLPGDTVDAFTLNDEFGAPLKKFPFQTATVISVPDAKNWEFHK